MTLSPATLPADTVNVAYSQTITAGGGTGNKTLTVSNVQNAIAGLVVPTSGTNTLNITGTPTATGTETFTVTATDSLGDTATINYSITVNGTVTGPVISSIVVATTATTPVITWNVADDAGIGSTSIAIDGKDLAVGGPYGRARTRTMRACSDLSAGSHTYVITATDVSGLRPRRTARSP